MRSLIKWDWRLSWSRKNTAKSSKHNEPHKRIQHGGGRMWPEGMNSHEEGQRGGGGGLIPRVVRRGSLTAQLEFTEGSQLIFLKWPISTRDECAARKLQRRSRRSPRYCPPQVTATSSPTPRLGRPTVNNPPAIVALILLCWLCFALYSYWFPRLVGALILSITQFGADHSAFLSFVYTLCW